MFCCVDIGVVTIINSNECRGEKSAESFGSKNGDVSVLESLNTLSRPFWRKI